MYCFHCFLSACYTDPRELDVVTITLRSDPRSFTDSELTTIREQIALLLHQQGSVNININIDDVMVEPKSGILSFLFSFCVSVLLLVLFTGYTRTVLQFFTTVKSENGWRTLPGTEVAALLKKKLRNDINLLAYPVLEVDTFICQNNCSGITVNIKLKTDGFRMFVCFLFFLSFRPWSMRSSYSSL